MKNKKEEKENKGGTELKEKEKEEEKKEKERKKKRTRKRAKRKRIKSSLPRNNLVNTKVCFMCFSQNLQKGLFHLRYSQNKNSLMLSLYQQEISS